MNQSHLVRDLMHGGKNTSSLRRIAVVRSLVGLGDFLCVIPALRSLRAALPQAEITLVSLSKTKALVERFHHYVDQLLEFPGYPGLPEQIPQLQEIPAFFANAQNQQFDLAIQMHGSGGLTNPITVLLGARINAGFFMPGHYCPDPHNFLPYVDYESEVRRYLRLMEFLGIPAQGEALEFPLQAIDYKELSTVETTHSLQFGHYVCIHPGASVVSRCWSPERFAIVADALADYGFQIVLTGSVAEQPLTQAIAALMHAKPINLAGATSLGALAVLLKGARLIVCNDTGVSHLADALEVPSVVIFTGSDPNRWAPLNRMLHRVVWSAADSTPDDVIAQADALLQKETVLFIHKAGASLPSIAVQRGRQP